MLDKILKIFHLDMESLIRYYVNSGPNALDMSDEELLVRDKAYGGKLRIKYQDEWLTIPDFINKRNI